MNLSPFSLFIACLLALAMFTACSDDAEHRARLDRLVRDGARQDDLIKALGPGVTIYERWTPGWTDLQAFLDGEPQSRFRPLRDAVKEQKYARIAYYTTAWRMTWVFIDEQGVLRDYYLSVQ